MCECECESDELRRRRDGGGRWKRSDVSGGGLKRRGGGNEIAGENDGAEMKSIGARFSCPFVLKNESMFCSGLALLDILAGLHFREPWFWGGGYIFWA